VRYVVQAINTGLAHARDEVLPNINQYSRIGGGN